MEELNTQMSDEQRKRLDLVEEYEKATGTDREARNGALAEHEREYNQKWMTLQGEMEMKRAETIERLRGDGRVEQQIDSMVAAEMAATTERYMAEKDTATRTLELAAPQSWHDWLLEKKQQHPADPTFDSLIDEAKTSPALDGYLKNPAPKSVVSDLMPSPASDGRVDYMRGMLVAVTDTGPRLDVKRNNERDIEAALKIAAQKFDMDKGLMLTGDLAFKRQAAEIAGRLGYKLQNVEPEVLMAYKKGLEQAAKPDLARVPSVMNGIEGDALDRAISVLKGPMILQADQHTIETLKNRLMPGVEATSGETVMMPGERVWQAHAEMRELPSDVLPILSEIDMSKATGGLSPEHLAKLEKENQGLVENGELTQKALDMVLVRDSRVIKSRAELSPEERVAFGPAYMTSGDAVRNREPETPEQKQKQDQAQEPQQIAKPDMPELTTTRKKIIDLGR